MRRMQILKVPRFHAEFSLISRAGCGVRYNPA
jgi:hypothetical protein